MSINFITNKRSCLGCVHYDTKLENRVFENEARCARIPNINLFVSEERKVPTALAMFTQSCGKIGIHYKPNKEYTFKPNMEF